MGLPAGIPVRARSGSLRVLTYNIQFCRGVDRVIDPVRIAAVIASFDPDVVALQEVDVGCARSGHRDQVELLGTALGMQVAFGTALPLGTGQSGNATLSRLPIVRTHRITLPVRRSVHEPRCALVTRVGWHGCEVDIINIHLSDRSATDRLAQAELVIRSTGDVPTVVCGDLNCTPWSEPFRTLARRLRPVASPRSWPSPLPVIALDHILVRGLAAVRAGLWRGPGVRRASDHLPVFAELTMHL